ncbi:MAG TPA: hypothetical protein VF133_13740, partial [Terriglobales bacterium]
QVAKVAKAMVLILTLGALMLAIYSSMSLMSLLLMGFAGVTQLFPGVILGLFSKRVTTAGIFAGLLAGIVLSVALMLTGRDPYHGLNAGFLALGLNFAVTAAVTALTPADANGFGQPELPLAANSAKATFT